MNEQNENEKKKFKLNLWSKCWNSFFKDNKTEERWFDKDFERAVQLKSQTTIDNKILMDWVC